MLYEGYVSYVAQLLQTLKMYKMRGTLDCNGNVKSADDFTHSRDEATLYVGVSARRSVGP